MRRSGLQAGARAGRLQHECLPAGHASPVSLIVRHGERFYLWHLKYVRQSAPSVGSPIMRQVRKPLVPSYQVSGAEYLISVRR